MTEKINSQLLKTFCKTNERIGKTWNEFYFWGIKSTTDKGDDFSRGFGLIFANKEIFAVGELYKLINKQHDYFWAPKSTNRSCKYMFAFSSIESKHTQLF